MAQEHEVSFHDVIGPIMVGPSSSHTAGACRIGSMARQIYGKTPTEVQILLHGSFGETYQGHGTDRALIGGLLGFSTDDERIIHAMEIADQEGLTYHFMKYDLGAVHPNTVEIRFLEEGKDPQESFRVRGSSIGGGQVRIIDIDHVDTNLDGKNWTLIAQYGDRPNMVFDITKEISVYDLNIGTMQIQREDEVATLIAEFDQPIPEALYEKIRSIRSMRICRVLPALL